MDLKSIVKYIIELGLNAPALYSMQKKTGHKVFLLLSPQYLNFGDHAIALSEIKNLQKLFPESAIVDANYSMFEFWSEQVKKAIRPGDVIVVTGGGFMGNLWPANQTLTEKVIELFPDNRIVFAPQTIFFKDTPTAAAEKAAFRDKLIRHGNFFFYGRDEQSCRQMAELGFVRGRAFDLMPDFVLMMPPLDGLHLRSGNAAVCLRADEEAADGLRAQVEQALAALIPGQIDSIKMAQDHAEIPVWLREKFVRDKLQQFADAGIIVTDRLHGMIYATYTGTPCIAFDNVSKKVSGVHEWIKSLDYVVIAHDISELPELIDRIKNKPKEENRRAFLDLQKKLSAKYLPLFKERLK